MNEMRKPRQLYYEDVEVGTVVTPLVKTPSTVALVRYAAAADDFSPIHFDGGYARTRGMNSVITHGLFKAACLGQMLTDWAGPKGWVKKFATKYQRVNAPNDPMTCRGKVIKKVVDKDSHFVEVEVWTENGKGELTTSGQATVLLPARGKGTLGKNSTAGSQT
jgi:acyl dehydratase